MENQEKNTGYVEYEYMSLDVKQADQALYFDCYENFGWKLINEGDLATSKRRLNMRFKRDRKIKNKQQIVLAQKKCEGALSEIARLEEAKTSMPSLVAYLIGFVGIAGFAGSVFSYVGETIIIPSFIICGLVGFAGCFLSYVAYKKLRNKKIKEIAPQIDKQFEIVYEACGEAKDYIK